MKIQRGGFLIQFSAVAMELCWLQAWGEFLTLSIFNCRLPFLCTAIIYLGGVAATWFCHLKKRFVIQVWLVQTTAFFSGLFVALYLAIQQFNTNPARAELKQLLSLDKGILEWLLVLLILVVSLVVWKRGVVSVSSPLDSKNMYNRFELGIAAFAALLIIRAMMLHKFEFSVNIPAPELSYLPFFLFGLLSIGLVGISNKNTKSYATGFQKIGFSLGFSVVVLIVGVAIVLLFNSQLTSTAEVVSVAFRKTGGSLGQILIRMLLFLWRPRGNSAAAPSNMSGSQVTRLQNSEQMNEPGLFETIVALGFMGLMIVVGLVLLYSLLKLILGYLFSKTGPAGKPDRNPWRPLLWLLRVISRLRALSANLIDLFRVPAGGADFYFRLLRWGCWSGIALESSETPGEYGRRLGSHFPVLEKELLLLVNLINQDIYGNQAMTPQKVERAKNACRKLSHPAHWPIRLKTWLKSH